MFTSEDVQAAGGTVFSASADGLGKVKSAQSLLWNSQSRTSMREVARDFRPNLVHYHSIYHQLSPSVLGALQAPSVMTLHDYKLSAPCYTLYRDGEVCDACVGKAFALPAIRFRCVSDSLPASALCAAEGMAHRRRYRSAIGRFIVPSRFAADIAVRGGLPAERVSVIPWGIERNGNAVSHNSKVAFFGGRLHRTKGLEILLEGWRSLPSNHGAVLRIAGEGELEPLVRRVASTDPTVEFVGMLSGTEVKREIEAAAIAVVPSLFPETMGLSALEALVAGTPVLSSGRGALADLAGPGVWTLPNVDVPSMRTALVRTLIEDKAIELRKDLGARDLSLYSFDRMVDAIEDQYRTVSEDYDRAL